MVASAGSSVEIFSQFVRRELSLNPGRARAIGRTALGCAITVGLAMVFQIPLPAYMAYVVLLVSRDEAAGTLVTALGGVIAATLAVALSLLFYVLDASEPALRLFLLAVSTCGGVFVTRTSSIGPIVFLAGFILVLSQTLIDDAPNPEVITHLLLWLWLVAAIPATVTAFINVLFGESPVDAVRRHAVRLIDSLVQLIHASGSQDVYEISEAILSIAELRKHAQLWDTSLKTKAAEDGRLVELLAEVFQLALALPRSTSQGMRRKLANSLSLSRRYFTAHSSQWNSEEILADGEDGSTKPVAFALQSAIDEIRKLVTHRDSFAVTPERKRGGALFVPDAFSNPAHIKFALKVTLAVMASYATYTLLNWPGIRTAVTTCFFAALGSLGESMHKLALRLAGAVVGGVLAGLCIVFILPLMTDIGQLLALIFVFSSVCAWVASSSARLSYAGLQMAFAFFLGVLQSYGPATDLTALRDRVLGILIGNIWMSIIFGLVWPVTSSMAARAALAKALSAAVRILSVSSELAGTARYLAVQKLNEAHRLSFTSIFEWKFRSGIGDIARRDDLLVETASRLVSSTFVASRERSIDSGEDYTEDANWLARAGEGISSDGHFVVESSIDGHEPSSSLWEKSPGSPAHELVRREIARAASIL